MIKGVIKIAKHCIRSPAEQARRAAYYSVYDIKTDLPIIIHCPTQILAKRLGITDNAIRRSVIRYNNGITDSHYKYYIVRDTDQEPEPFWFENEKE